MPIASAEESGQTAGHARGRACLALALAAGLGGCSLFGPTEGQVYELSTISGLPLPVAVYSSYGTVGGLFELQVERGTVELFPTLKYEQRLEVRQVYDGVPADTVVHVVVLGRVERQDTTLIVWHREPILGRITRTTYYLLDDGRVLQGSEGLYGVGSRTYRYLRR